LTGFKEHTKYGRFEKSSVAKQIFDKGYRIDESYLKLLIKNVNSCTFLKIYETINNLK
jgi:hypothetical protein